MLSKAFPGTRSQVQGSRMMDPFPASGRHKAKQAEARPEHSLKAWSPREARRSPMPTLGSG
eukprot:3423701-Alexandrium_andersonii.AAC.1